MNSQKSEITLKPIRGKEQELLTLDIIEGSILVATDTGSMYMDTNGKRVSIGGSGSPFIYAEAEGLEPDENGNYTLNFSDLESDNLLPQVDGLIINVDGTFYRILQVDTEAETMLCMVIAVSGGSGGSGTGLAKSMSIKGSTLSTPTLVNGQTMSTTLTVSSAVDAYGDIEDESLTVNWIIKTTSDSAIYAQGSFKADSGVPYEFEFGTRLRENAGSTLTFQAVGVNSGTSKILTYSVTTVDLQLLSHTSFNSSTVYASNFTMYCNITGAIEKVLDFYIDEDLVGTKILARNITGMQSFSVTRIGHGYHTVRIELYQSIDGERGVGVTPLEFEIAVNTGDIAPIIWLGDYASKYYSYDSIKIPFTVFNPNSSNSTVRFFKGIAELENSPRTVTNSTNQILEITNATVDATSVYYIRVEGFDVYREIQIEVETDPNRDMSLVYPENLLINFDAAGRSNDESETNRQIWNFTTASELNPVTYAGNFKNFNWYNNGWILDENNNTCLRIANGAQFSIPLGVTDINTTTAGKQSITFEFEFKVRNVQDYSNLIKEITRYVSDAEYWAAYNAQTEYDNYDQFLQAYLPTIGVNYDSVTEKFAFVYKQISLNATFCRYYNEVDKIGLCLGPQDGFFATGSNTVSVKYVEDELTKMSVVFNYNDEKIYIYLNGVLTGVSNIDSSGKITINSPVISFNSDYCDLDLYKFRAYNTALSVVDIDTNYSVDLKDVLIYDHTNQLVQYNTSLKEYQFKYDAMMEFNEGHPYEYLMPYLIVETALGDKLPYSKANKKTVSMEFVNTGLDRAYATGELETLARQAGYVDELDGLTAVQQYYRQHCPSWKGENISFAVQGTSSEFYPRRNYKAKTKDGNGVINMCMHKGPFAAAYAKDPEETRLDFFYYNNDTVGTTKFTLKIDFMESSGTYNMGFANLVKTAYSKHPLNDYNDAGAFQKEIVSYNISNNGYDETEDYYSDARGKNEVKFADPLEYVPGKYYVQQKDYEPYTFSNVDDYRTSCQGFPVLTFWKDSNGNCTFIGRYNMLTDKGSDEVYGFKPAKSIVQKFKGNKRVRDAAQCWEFSNNNRGFCSFRDPMNRKELSFKVFDENGAPVLNSASSCPVVSDSFEYRYHKEDDLLDYFYDDSVVTTTEYEELVADNDGKDLSNMDVRTELLMDNMKEWEKAVAWVWSTCTDIVPSMGKYKSIDLSEALYEEGKYYIYDGDNYEISNAVFDSEITYYTSSDQGYISIKLTDDASLIYIPKVYYTLLNGNYILSEDLAFDPSAEYYQLIVDETIVADDLVSPVTYAGVTYSKDTKEYRLAKFKAEFADHFSLEYALVYWIMTEVFLCYDSRGKNCMMSSWGPQKDGGEYIWYPIFYDIDTQLGINNTGIPSYDYSVNASIDGCFSTSDSVLWNNLYSCFFANLKSTYHSLKNNVQNVNTGTAVTGPIYTVKHIEDWYLANAEVCNQINMRGDRPLIALNMDEFYKYISTCNPAIQYQNRQGTMSTDNGTYFYALQGDRSLSRQQFLARRINFIDSWLSDGDYSRSEGTDIHGRIAANNPAKNSDKWIEGSATNGAPVEINTSYYELDGSGQPILDERGYPKKTYYLDADTFVALTPYQKSYVTLGDDNEAFSSQPYEGTAVKFNFPATLANGIRTSGNYPEQLLYLYGAASLKDIGDISKLYWTEFYAVNSPHISRVLIGNDHPQFYNKALKMPNFDAGTENKGKPLLKEVNMTNVTVDNGSSSISFDFSSSEKMTIFKATGSNIENVAFADGVALHTLHLPTTMTSLKLVEANNLTKVLDTKPISTYNATTDTWTAEQGLYIAQLTDAEDLGVADSDISSIILAGGALRYDSYKLLNALYTIKKRTKATLKISLTKVDWSPYKRIDEGYKYNAEEASLYYKDNGHYGFTSYGVYDKRQWEADILNGEVYKLDTTITADEENLPKLEMFQDFYTNDYFKNTDDFNNEVPEITGDVYINNVDEIDEGFIRNTLLEYYPGINFHFSNVKKAYSAKFITMESDGTYTTVGTQKISQDDVTVRPWFENPYTLYTAEKPNYDFHGWSTTVLTDNVIASEDWNKSQITEGKFDYTFYAIFTKHVFSMRFLAGTSDADFKEIETIPVTYGENLMVPAALPSIDESKLDTLTRYKFLGYTQNKNNVIAPSENKADLRNVISMLATQDYTFYAVFVEESVYNSPTPDQYFTYSSLTSYQDAYDESYTTSGYMVSVKEGITLNGKITIPSFYNGLPVVSVQREGFSNQTGVTHIFFYKETGKPILVRELRSLAFSGCVNLKYCELPTSLRKIGDSTFTRCSSLVLTEASGIIAEIGQNAFNQALAAPSGQSTIDFYIGGTVQVLGQNAFSNNSVKINEMVIGTAANPSQLISVGQPTVRQNGGYELRALTIYCTSARLVDFFNTLTYSTEGTSHFQLERADSVSFITV